MSVEELVLADQDHVEPPVLVVVDDVVTVGFHSTIPFDLEIVNFGRGVYFLFEGEYIPLVYL